MTYYEFRYYPERHGEKYAIREYLKRKDKNLNKLSDYAEKLGIKEEVMDYIEVFYE